MGTLHNQLSHYAEHMTTKAEIIDYYQREYPSRGKGSWKQMLVNTLSAMTGQKPKTLEKRFDVQRRNNPEPKNAQQYKDLGAMLPPQLPKGEYHVTGIVWVKFSDGACEERDVDEVLSYEEAVAMLKMNSRDAAQMLVNKYMEEEPDEDEPTASIGDCNPPDLEVTLIEEE